MVDMERKTQKKCFVLLMSLCQFRLRVGDGLRARVRIGFRVRVRVGFRVRVSLVYDIN